MSSFDRLAPEHGVRTDIAEAFGREWDSLRRPGSYYTSSQKVQVCGRARKVQGGESPNDDLPEPTRDAVDMLTTAPSSVRRRWVEELLRSGLSMIGYVETVSLVTRISNIDAFHDVLGIARPDFPEPVDGSPTGEFNPKARSSKAYVPMTRGASIWWSLSLVPEAYERMADLHCALYLSPEQMQASGTPRTLSRAQMEVIASRMSVVNECFY